MLPADLLGRRETHFTLWRPNENTNAPKLVIGTFQAGNPNIVANRTEFSLVNLADTPGLWTLSARDTGLADGIYHYWYRVDNTHPGRPAGSTVLVTDPFASTVDWRVLSEIPADSRHLTIRSRLRSSDWWMRSYRRQIRAERWARFRTIRRRTSFR